MLTSTRERTEAGTLADVSKDKLLTVRVSEEDVARLRRLADHYALNVSSVIRMLAKRAVDDLGPAPAEPPAYSIDAEMRKTDRVLRAAKKSLKRAPKR